MYVCKTEVDLDEVQRLLRYLLLQEDFLYPLGQKSANFFCKGPDSKYFRPHFVSYIWFLSHILLFFFFNYPSRMYKIFLAQGLKMVHQP